MDSISRDKILKPLISRLKELDYALALWEQGAASFNRVDEWSDIDLILIVDDDKVEDAFRETESLLTSISEISLKYRLPEPTWHGHSQVFYRLKNTSPFLFIDLCIMKKSSNEKFLQYSIHSRPVVYLDKSGIIKDESPNPEDHLVKIEKRLESLKTTFALFQVETIKEVNRGNYLEAIAFYTGNTYRPLVEVLRIKYVPWRYNFHTRYIHYELPSEIVERLRKLAYISSIDELIQAREKAEEWFWEVVKSIKMDEVLARLK